MTTDTEKQFSIARWTLMTFCGWLIGLIGFAALESLSSQTYVRLALSFGAFIGFAQWMYLRRIISMNIKWFFFSVLGMTAPMLILLLTFEILLYLPLILVVLSVLLAAFLQASLLRHNYAKANQWIWGSLCSWAACAAFALGGGKIVDGLTRTYEESKFGFITLIIAAGFVLGGVSGVFMKRVVRSRIR